MRLVSFDSLRTWDLPGARPFKPEDWFRAKHEVMAADWVLFPRSWQVNPLVYGWKKRIFPSINSYHLGYDKVEMTRAFEAVAPEHVPTTRILSATERSVEQVLDEFEFPLVAKEVRNSMGQGVFLIEDRAALLRHARANDVLYVQEYLPIERDLRVVIVGRRAVAAYWREAAPGCFYTNLARGGTISFADVPVAAVELVERVATQLGIDHAGFDVAEVDGHYFLFEFNLWFGTQALNQQGLRLGPVILRYLREQTVPPWEPGAPLLPKVS